MYLCKRDARKTRTENVPNNWNECYQNYSSIGSNLVCWLRRPRGLFFLRFGENCSNKSISSEELRYAKLNVNEKEGCYSGKARPYHSIVLFSSSA